MVSRGINKGNVREDWSTQKNGAKRRWGSCRRGAKIKEKVGDFRTGPGKEKGHRLDLPKAGLLFWEEEW